MLRVNGDPVGIFTTIEAAMTEGADRAAAMIAAKAELDASYCEGGS